MFFVNFEKFLRAPIFKALCERLLLKAGFHFICNSRANVRTGLWLVSRRAMRCLVELDSTNEPIHWLSLILPT